MKRYLRPLLQTGPRRPEDALTLAGGWCWFNQVEILSRQAESEVVAAKDLPAEDLSPLTGPRAPVAGLSLDRPRVMGILNVTPDSFSDGGAHDDPASASDHARRMVEAGADILDVGGESTRPGAEEVAVETEIARVQPVLQATADLGVPVSIDTRKVSVAEAACAAGAALINDVSGFTFDPDLAPFAARAGVPVCLMHAQGLPEEMQKNPTYDNVLLDVFDVLEARIAALEAIGIPKARILADPGIGFGKTLEHNMALLQRVSLFHGLGVAVLLGVSRKGFIGTIGGAPVEERDAGSVGVALAAVAQGVQVLRVHDVRSHAQAIALWQATQVGAGG